MRLTCPNCDAQYEVPDDVIPKEGRDVQCSNCGDTWFQAKYETPDPSDDLATDVSFNTPSPDLAPVSEPEAAPEPVQRDHVGDTPDTRDVEPEPNPEEPKPPRQQQDIAPAISDILRQEAEREAQLRAAESAEPLESQPDLGLDNMPGDEPTRRASEARSRMARMRGEDQAPPEPATNPGSRRGLLPDIEEINSTLSNSDSAAGASSKNALGPTNIENPKKKRSGFARGFALIMIAGVVLGVIYAKASNISQAVPQAEPVLSSYVGLVDQARVWIDARLGEYLSK